MRARHVAVSAAHLDPYLGFLHGVQFGKPSLVCDLMEPWRCMVESFILDYHEELDEDCFILHGRRSFLKPEPMHSFTQALDRHIDQTRIPYNYRDNSKTTRIRTRARRCGFYSLALYVGETSNYQERMKHETKKKIKLVTFWVLIGLFLTILTGLLPTGRKDHYDGFLSSGQITYYGRPFSWILKINESRLGHGELNYSEYQAIPFCLNIGIYSTLVWFLLNARATRKPFDKLY